MFGGSCNLSGGARKSRRLRKSRSKSKRAGCGIKSLKRNKKRVNRKRRSKKRSSKRMRGGFTSCSGHKKEPFKGGRRMRGGFGGCGAHKKVEPFKGGGKHHGHDEKHGQHGGVIKLEKEE